MGKLALITGATAGIGKAAAFKFAENGWDLIITGRRKDRLSALETELKQFNIKVLSLNFDVRNKEEVESHLSELPVEFSEVNLLLNNAGLAAGFGTIDQGNTDFCSGVAISYC